MNEESTTSNHRHSKAHITLHDGRSRSLKTQRLWCVCVGGIRSCTNKCSSSCNNDTKATKHRIAFSLWRWLFFKKNWGFRNHCRKVGLREITSLLCLAPLSRSPTGAQAAPSWATVYLQVVCVSDTGQPAKCALSTNQSHLSINQPCAPRVGGLSIVGCVSMSNCVECDQKNTDSHTAASTHTHQLA
jgi:hypothetical protein